MEFFACAARTVSPEALANRLSVAALPKLCASIDSVLEDNGNRGRICCVWGEFEIVRQPINGGVRFILPHCPNAFSWTVTTGHPPDSDAIVVHATINRTAHDPDFIETLEDFVTDWRAGLEKVFNNNSQSIS